MCHKVVQKYVYSIYVYGIFVYSIYVYGIYVYSIYVYSIYVYGIHAALQNVNEIPLGQLFAKITLVFNMTPERSVTRIFMWSLKAKK